jgi:hypothetical protein
LGGCAIRENEWGGENDHDGKVDSKFFGLNFESNGEFENGNKPQS